MGDCDLARKSTCPRKATIPPPLRGTRLRVGPLCRCATSPHTVGSHPLHKGGFVLAQPYWLIAYKKMDVGGGVAGSRSDQCPSGALNRTSVPALLDGGARCAPPSADAPCNFRRVAKFPGGYGIRPYANPKFWPRRGQCGGRRKSVKKNAALLHFLAFSSTDHPFGVPRGRAPWAGVRCLGTARLFSLPFLVTKKEGLTEESI